MMPRPRFSRLDPEKQERILEAAAQAFAAHGFEEASLNQILEEAQISKGAAYYYFDDKADLFATAVAHYTAELMGDLPLTLGSLDRETFWPTLTEYYQRQFAYSHDRPWAFGVAKAAARLSPEIVAANPSLARLMDEMKPLLEELIATGQAVGAVRTDLPQSLLIQLLMAVDDASDRWLLEHWQELEPQEIEEVVGRVMSGLSRLLAPVEENEND
jgi:AcrR family transcriptional regulator